MTITELRNILVYKMQVRTVNKELRYWAWDIGVTKAAKKARVSLSLLDKVINGRYPMHGLRPETMSKIARAAGMLVDEAFPLVSANEAS